MCRQFHARESVHPTVRAGLIVRLPRKQHYRIQHLYETSPPVTFDAARN